MTSSERPILFSGPMVCAILDGLKTQTRRVVRLHPSSGYIVERGGKRRWHPDDPDAIEACPYGAPGDTLWVRETWAYYGGDEYLYQRIAENVMYRATWADDPRCPTYSAGEPVGDRRWRPSIHMPRWASRLSLPIKSRRLERLQEISEADCCAEGVGSPITRDLKRPKFQALWDSINGKRAPWASNLRVWVIEFERVGGGS